MKVLYWGLWAGLLLALSGCGSTRIASCEDGRDVIWFSTVSKRMLENGMRQYEEGNYPAALNILQNVPDHPLASRQEKLEAYKLMAFIHCVSGREKQCRDSFKRAIDLDPKFELKPSEVGHPLWGPVFRSVQKAAASVPGAASTPAAPASAPAVKRTAPPTSRE